MRTVYRSGVSLMEVLVTVGVIAILGGAVIPTYRSYKMRSDLHLAVEQTVQSLHRVQLLSQSGQENAVWGFRADEGVLFKGVSYSARDASFDETFPVPIGVTVSGLLEVTYSQVYGVPSTEGDIVFTAMNGDQVVVTVTADSVLSAPQQPSSSSAPSSSTSSKVRYTDDDSDEDEDDEEGDEDEDDDN